MPRFPDTPPGNIERQGVALIADGVDAVLRATREQLMKGASQIKIMAGGGVSSLYDPLDGVQYTEAEHPIFMAAAHPHWLLDEDGRKTWPVNGYSVQGERRTDWFASGVLKHHRTLATTVNTLIGPGFALRRVEEFAPTAAQIEAMPDLAEELERPMMLLISARKA